MRARDNSCRLTGAMLYRFYSINLGLTNPGPDPRCSLAVVKRMLGAAQLV